MHGKWKITSQKSKNFKNSLMLLLKSLKPYRFAVIFSLFLSVIGTVLALILPNLLKDSLFLYPQALAKDPYFS